MKFILALFFLTTVASAQKATPFDFDLSQLKNIWEAPELQPALKNLVPNYDPSVERGGRITNGQYAVRGQFPHHVLLVIDSAYWCGGSLLNGNWVLTVSRQISSKHIHFFTFLKGRSLH